MHFRTERHSFETVEILVNDESRFIPVRLGHGDFPVTGIAIKRTEDVGINQRVDELIHPRNRVGVSNRQGIEEAVVDE